MTTSSSFDTSDDGSDKNTGGREGVGEREWERDVLADIVEDDEGVKFLIMDQEFDDAYLKSTLSVDLRKME